MKIDLADIAGIGYAHLIARGVALPSGRLPTWNPVTPISAAFRTIPVPQVNCSTGGRLDNICDWPYMPLFNFQPSYGTPRAFGDAWICNYASADDLAQDVENWHDNLHNIIGGLMSTMDSPAAPVFWIWHAYIDEIYQRYLGCP